MKVLTLNTHSWMEEDIEKQVNVLAQTISVNDYDIISLQEVNQRRDAPEASLDPYFQSTIDQKSLHEDNFMYLLIQQLKKLGCFYYWSWVYNHIGYDIYHEGIGILSKTPIDTKSLLISRDDDPEDYRTRKVLIARTQYEQKEMMVVNGHFSWWISSDEGFSYEWHQLETELKKSCLPLLVMGDFNNSADISNEGYQLVLNSSLKLLDSYQQAKVREGEGTVEKPIDGWESNLGSIRIDYVFSQSDFEAQTYKILFDGKDIPKISDHLGIETSFSWSK
ncbi:endonuclease/exonuclease/phosphatase family protein [Enterococcus sp. AZ109]|uniref:endonuclease/exonuclease/phosphatase family protein n=1 Tax=Enterococcus sp. AZ109 TaxID=2774634 RepID=UPI003F274F87